MANVIDVDERVRSVQAEGGKRAFLAMSWLLCADMVVRGLRPEVVDWNGFPVDIVAILLLGGVVFKWTEVRAQASSKWRWQLLVAAVTVSVVIGAVVAFLRMRS